MTRNSVKNVQYVTEYECGICKMNCTQRSDLITHIENWHSYKCEQCSKIFTSCSDVETHMENAHGYKYRPCDDDKNVTVGTRKKPDSDVMMRHNHFIISRVTKYRNVHIGLGISNRRFRIVGGMKNHVRMMHSKSECGNCGRMFTIQADFHAHKEKCKIPTRCEYVNQAVSLDFLRSHSKTCKLHTYKCSQCSKIFQGLGFLEVHVKRFHNS